jgi:hypothetical protein
LAELEALYKKISPKVTIPDTEFAVPLDQTILALVSCPALKSLNSSF